MKGFRNCNDCGKPLLYEATSNSWVCMYKCYLRGVTYVNEHFISKDLRKHKRMMFQKSMLSMVNQKNVDKMISKYKRVMKSFKRMVEK